MDPLGPASNNDIIATSSYTNVLNSNTQNIVVGSGQSAVNTTTSQGSETLRDVPQAHTGIPKRGLASSFWNQRLGQGGSSSYFKFS
jgi:arabinogalactan endo-1,4-beta-galactosidase